MRQAPHLTERQAWRASLLWFPDPTQPQAQHETDGLLVTGQTLTNREAQQLLTLLFSPGAQWLSLGSVQGSQLSARQPLAAIGIPLHPGALQILKDVPAGKP